MAFPVKPADGFRKRVSSRLSRFYRPRQRDTKGQAPSASEPLDEQESSTRNLGDVRPTIARPQGDQTTGGDHTTGINPQPSRTGPDIWSSAYQEAIHSFGDEIDVAILRADSVAGLFRSLEEIAKDTAQKSVFIRGVERLREIRVPLETFKLALDLATPLSRLEPTVATVFGLVSSVTAIAISFATADYHFAEQVGELLKHLAYIDDCDTLGLRSDQEDIHKLLVAVYRELLEFYRAAHEILTRTGLKLMLKVVLETKRLPEIVAQIVSHAASLDRLVSKATAKIVQDLDQLLRKEQVEKWLGREQLRGQSNTQSQLQSNRDDQACKFVLEDPSFNDWYQKPDSQWLLLLGDVGCGKSVVMSYVVDELNRRNKTRLPQPKTCFYFCRDELDGQSAQIFSALILSMCQQLKGLNKTFYDWFVDIQASGVIDPAASPKKLGDFLLKVTRDLDRPLFIVIDGVDECIESTRSCLFDTLRAISQNDSRTKIMLSSRPDQGIIHQLGPATRIEMRPDLDRDAQIVLSSVSNQLSGLSDDVKALVIQSLAPLAKGSALWIAMVVEMIRIGRHTAYRPMHSLLLNLPLPDKLGNLYLSMISRLASNDKGNENHIYAALGLLAYTRRPLSIQELAWGVAISEHPDQMTTVASLAETLDEGRLVKLIYPFITITNPANLTDRQIQLCHHSVKEFIDRQWAKKQYWSDGSVQMARYGLLDTLEQYVLEICLDYLLLEEIGSTPLFSDVVEALQELPPEADIFEEMEASGYDANCSWESWEESMARFDPDERGLGGFFTYAASHWVVHVKFVPMATKEQLEKIKILCHAGSVRLNNWIEQNCRPDCAMTARFEFESKLYDPLSITALYASGGIFSHAIECWDYDDPGFLRLSALKAADQILQWGCLSRLRNLFTAPKLRSQLHDLAFFRLIIKGWIHYAARHDDWASAFELVETVDESLVPDDWAVQLLFLAAGAGCLPVIQGVLNWAQNKPKHRYQLIREAQWISEAVLADQMHVVEFLLSQEDFEIRFILEGDSVLQLAAKARSPEMLSLLTSTPIV